MAPEPVQSWIQGALARYEAPLLRYAASIVGGATAPDVVQDTFLALCRAAPEKVEGHLGPWLFVVCRNRALELLREGSRLQPLEEQDVTGNPDSEPWRRVERQQSLGRVQHLLRGLPDRQREAVMLKFAAGLSYKEMAEVMELSVSHVGVILHTALTRLRLLLAESTEALSVGGEL
jgi:RNA polymerase sigma factor (sigma-70 family)